MSTAAEWIETFTGVKMDGSPAAEAADLGAQAEALEAEAERKRVLLAAARRELGGVKAAFQAAMKKEVKIQGKVLRQRLLEADGTQMDEADFTEIDFSGITFSKEAQDAVDRGTATIADQHERLKAETIDRGAGPEPLFSKPELQEGFWAPLVRERILPETFVGDMYSQTKQMIDETNALYEQAVAAKKESGELTPEASRGRDAVDTASDLLSVAAELTSAFGPGTAEAKRAVSILKLVSAATSAGGQVYDKVKEREFADAASLALDNVGTLTVFILGQKGASKETLAAVKSGFTAGNSAIAAGKAFARGEEGVQDGLTSFADVLERTLTIAADATPDAEQGKRLAIAATAAPALLKASALGIGLARKIEEGDPDGIVDCLTEAAKTALSTAIQVEKAAAPGAAPGRERQGAEIASAIDLAGVGLKTAINVGIMARKGEHIKALNRIVSGVGEGLSTLLVKAGVDEKKAAQVASIYKAAAAAPAILEALCDEGPGNVESALDILGQGIEDTFKAAAPENRALLQAGAGLKNGIKGLVSAKRVNDLIAAGKYDEAVEAFSGELQSQVQGIFDIKDMRTASEEEAAEEEAEETPPPGEEGDEGKEEEEEAPLNEKVKGLIGELGETVKAALGDINAGLAAQETAAKAAEKAEDARAAEEIVQRSLAELAPLSEAEAAAIDASSMDALIAKIEKDRILWEMAIQIAEGGSAFAAQFVPALGIPGTVARLAANMVAAGNRLQQYARWVDNQRDFERAQDALSSAARNFAKNQGSQAAHYTLQSLFKAASLVGQVLELSGVAGPAGTALKTVAEAAGKLEEVIQRHHGAEKLEAAWKVTQASFANPANRKLALKARALNPSLAKYTIAWGAVKKRNPLARKALAACQLTEAALENENANVEKVVDYLERFYAEDDKLYREIEAQAEWIPADLDLSVGSWVKFKALAVEHVKLKNPQTGAIDGLLVLVEPDATALDEAGRAKQVQALEDLKAALAAYKPQAPNPKGAAIVAKAVGLFTKQAEQRLREVKDLAAAVTGGA